MLHSIIDTLQNSCSITLSILIHHFDRHDKGLRISPNNTSLIIAGCGNAGYMSTVHVVIYYLSRIVYEIISLDAVVLQVWVSRVYTCVNDGDDWSLRVDDGFIP